MAKNKLQKFAEMETFENIFQPPPHLMLIEDFHLKGKWNEAYFKNSNKLTLEIGCGKGEYTTGLAEAFPGQNYVGLDLKGARLWRGCKTAIEKGLNNVAFIRNKAEFLGSFFAQDEASEIWVTFPDPQPKRQKKRLTSSRFLNMYKNILPEGGIVHLKTDSPLMYKYTKAIAEHNNAEIICHTEDLYKESSCQVPDIKTFYESKFLAKGILITYISFRIEKDTVYSEPPESMLDEVHELEKLWHESPHKK